jgi:phosphoglycolate phosphatase-like HAD superfamily hydrolase
MKLVMFDIDGTLTDTHAADANGFVEAVRDELGITKIDTDWAAYPHATSEGVLDEVVRRATGQPVTLAQSQAVQRRLAERLRRASIMEIPGAGAFLRRLTEAGFAVALASGDWELTARLKLAAASIPVAGLPAAFCDTSRERTEIMRHSLRRSLAHHRRKSFKPIIYVGDGSWDVRASRELGWGFIGIESGTALPRLRALGACHVFPDFLRGEEVLAAIETAGGPH